MQQQVFPEKRFKMSGRPAVAAASAWALLAVVGAAGPAWAAVEEPKSKTLAFKPVWKMDLPAGTRRVAVADTAATGASGEEKAVRLLVLNAEGVLAIRKLSNAGAKEEASVSLGPGAAHFVVGHFARGGPAQIVVPSAVFYREGETYRKKALPDLTEVTGSVRFADGTENIFVMSRESPPLGYELDLAAEKPLKAGRDVPTPGAEDGAYREISPHLTPEIFENEPFPEPVKRGGLVRLFAPRADKRLYGILSWQAADGSYVAAVGGGDLFPEPAADMKPLWKSEKLSGKVLDIALGPDPKGGTESGFLVLTQVGDDGKGRQIEFFTLAP